MGAGYVVSHTGGLPPRTDPVDVTYPPEPLGVVDDALRTLQEGAERAVAAGVPPDRVLVDPTLDFGKTTAHSLTLLRHTEAVVALGYPVLQALSRKDFVGETLDLAPDDRLEGTLAATAVAAWLGATVFRAHDVRATRRVVDMVASIRGDRPASGQRARGAAVSAGRSLPASGSSSSGASGPRPFAGMVLAELGADVVRVDRPGETNPLALAGGLRRSRPSIAVDLKAEAGRAVVQRLVDDADVLLEGYRPGVAERLGLGPDECLARNPRLVHARMTGWGQTGPWARAGRPRHHVRRGVGHAARPRNGRRGRSRRCRSSATSPGGSMYVVVGILAALIARGTTGRGQVVDAAMVDGSAHLFSMVHGLLGAGAWRDEREANLLDGGAPFYAVYECADGRFVAVGALEPPFWAELCWPGWASRPRASSTTPAPGRPSGRRSRRPSAPRTRDEWAAHFDGTDACVAPVLSLREAPHHPHLAGRGTFVADAARPPRATHRPAPVGHPGARPRPRAGAGGRHDGLPPRPTGSPRRRSPSSSRRAPSSRPDHCGWMAG